MPLLSHHTLRTGVNDLPARMMRGILLSAIALAVIESAGAQQAKAPCPVVTFTLSPDVALTEATTKDQTFSGTSSFVVSPGVACGRANAFTVSTNDKYDLKQKSGGAATISRHHVGSVNDVVTLSNPTWGIAANAGFLSDNSLGLYLQQTYSGGLAHALSTGQIASQITVGGAFVGDYYSSAVPSVRYGGALLSGTFDYTTRVDTTVPAEKRSPPAELSFFSSNVVGRFQQSSSSATLGIPSLFRHFTLVVKTSLDYISNPPPTFKNHYFTIDVGPKFTINNLP